MNLSAFDLIAFALFVISVVSVSIYMSRKEDSSEDYFLAGRGLTWWLIGFSLIASNISSEHFVGMSGRGFDIGLAIASYEWMAAVTLVLVAFVLLPRFLRSGIYTIPEYLEYRYSRTARMVMAGFMMIAYVIVALASVLYSGALTLKTVFGMDMISGIWLIGLLAGVYTVYGGLKAVVWSDMIQGAALLLGGLLVTYLGIEAMGGVTVFLKTASPSLHTVLPWNHPEMPWVAVFVGGLWIPNIFYWGLNQFISQRTLAAKNLREGQKGIVLAAFMKLIIPFIIVIPGIIAAGLYGNQIEQADQAYPFLINRILPAGLRGIMFAALFGAVMSSLDSMLNSASTIFTMDIYRSVWGKRADSRKLVRVGRISTGFFVVVGCVWAPVISSFGSVYTYIQQIWGFISPGVVASFLFGIIVKKAPPAAAVGAMILGIPVYGLCLLFMPEIAFLHHMFFTLLVLVIYMTAVTIVKPLKEPREMPSIQQLDLTPMRGAKLWGGLVILATAALYIIFW